MLFFIIVSNQMLFAIDNPREILAEFNNGSEGSIFLLNHQDFVLIGYATFILGKYNITKNKIKFTPLKAELPFTILARENKTLKEKINITFEGEYVNSPVAIQFDDNDVMKVFPEDFEGGAPYYSMKIKKHQTISLSLFENTNQKLNTRYVFPLSPPFNEYLLFIHPPKEEEKAFLGILNAKSEYRILETQWGEFVENKDKPEEETIEYIFRYKALLEKQKSDSVFYFNDQYKGTYDGESDENFKLNLQQYAFDEESNKWIRKDIYQKGGKYIDEIAEYYHDQRILLEYRKIKILKKEIVENKYHLNDKSLFKI